MLLVKIDVWGCSNHDFVRLCTNSIDAAMPAFMGSKRAVSPQGGRGAKGGRTATGSSSNGLEDLCLSTAQLAMETKADVREIQGYTQWAALLPAALPCCQEGLAEGKEFSKIVKENKGKDVGAAHVRICVKTVAALAKMADFQADQAFKDSANAFWDQIICKLSPIELKEQIQVFRLTKPKVQSSVENKDFGEEGYCKLIFRFKPATKFDEIAACFQHHLIRMIKKLNYDIRVGTPPKTAAERKVEAEVKRRLNR